MARKTKEETEKTYYALLDAAQSLFVKQGVAKTTLSNIAKEAGMTRGAVYWHFENKEELILALWDERAGKSSKEMWDAFEHLSNESPVDDFRAVIQNGIQRILHDPALSYAIRIIMHSVEITEEESKLRDFLHTKNEEHFNSMKTGLDHLQKKGLIKVDVSTEVLTSGLLAYIYGLVQSHLEPHKRINLERDATILIDLSLSSFLKIDT